MSRSPRANGFLFLFMGTLFLILAIQSAGQTAGWDAITIILMAFAAFDFLLAFKFLSMAPQQDNDKKDS
ncbi:YdiK family protein [Alkalicoccus chagannorensis]|uniref:YdiK family protein n=1 Tax=Alkalicoccus chagannorensis TaxID=427072 RepID=UPI00041A170A|nr:YdiK family protein [Alkalicoccus chagannorensis]